MKYNFSSCAGAIPLLNELGAENLLMSFAVDAKQCHKADNQNVIIDSGAFSVWNKGISIDIDEYLQFCLKQPKEWTFINLDIIPKKNATAKEIESCCQQGYENYIYLKKHLKNVMPVYHQGEDFKWLHKFIETEDYIGIGFGNDRHEKHRREFLAKVFNITKDNIKLHGLGYSSFEGLTLFPFYSVDSISYRSFNIEGDRFMVCKPLAFYFRQRIKEFLQLEKEITQLWELRGIKW